MNSSLPNLSAVPVPATGAAPLNAAALADLGTLAAPGPALPGAFADLLAANPAAVVPATLPAATPGLILTALAAVPPPAPAVTAACPTVVLAPTTSASFSAPVPVAVPLPRAAVVVPATDAAAAVEAPVALVEVDDSLPAPSRDTLEEAAAFAATLVQALWPELTPAPVADGERAAPTVGLPAGTSVARDASPLVSTSRSSTTEAAVLDLPETPVQPAPAMPTDANTVAAPGAERPGFEVVLAADGAIELKLDRASGTPETDHAPASPAPIELHAELEMPGRAVLRLEATGGRPEDFAGFTGEAKIAAKNPVARAASAWHAGASERNFVFTEDKQVKTASPEAGIAVAQRDPIMSAAPIEEIRTTRPADPVSVGAVRPDFQVVPPPAERITAPATAPAGQNFAERAVATVTSLVDAQFSASMQRSGSVNLRLKFGGEDLSVRVELRGGAVHTAFQTDSPELRAALTREWQALTSSAPAESRRFLDPVFASAAPANAAGDGQPHSFGRQAQQQAAQQDLPQRQGRDQSESPAPFARRSLLSETFSPAPVEPRTPAFLPTSLRLSALA